MEKYRKRLLNVFKKYGNTPELHNRVCDCLETMFKDIGYEKAMEVYRSLRAN